MRKVEEWISEVERSQKRIRWDLHLQTTWNLPHIKRNSLLGNFAVSDSRIAVVDGRLATSSLTVMKLDKSGAFNIQLLEKNSYCSADFIKIKGKEYLAASQPDSNISLYDVEKSRWKEVFKVKDTRPKPKTMELCVLGLETIAFAEREPSEDGIHKIYILDASNDPDEWTVGGIVHVRGLKEIWSMCCVRSWSNCLVLCSYLDRCVQAVNIVSGRVIWRSDESNMGEGCRPWSICPGSNGASILVTDLCASQHKLLVLHTDTDPSIYLNLTFTIRVVYVSMVTTST